MGESPNTGIDLGNDDTKIKSIENLLKTCRDLQNKHHDDQLYFRGECCDSWELRPSIMRNTTEDKSTLRASEGEMLNELMGRQPEAFRGLNSAIEQWVLAQHHGLKTRLLDITRNPLVALFNACEKYDANGKDGRLHIFTVPKEMIKSFNSDTISVIANFAKLRYGEQNRLLGITEEDTGEGNSLSFEGEHAEIMRRLYHFIRHEKPYFLEEIAFRDIFRVFIVEPQQSFERIRAQAGAFLISAFHERFERDEILNWNAEFTVYDHYRLTVQDANKQDIMNDLSLLNITRESLFPGLDEAAQAVTQRYSEE